MNRLPLPSSWQGWLLALVLGVLFYPLYYLCLYPPLEHYLVFRQYRTAYYELDPKQGDKKAKARAILRYFPWVSTSTSSDLIVTVLQGENKPLTKTLKFKIQAEYFSSSKDHVPPEIQWGCKEKSNNLQCAPNLTNFAFQLNEASVQSRRISYVVVPGESPLRVNEEKFNFTLKSQDESVEVKRLGDVDPQVTYNPGRVFVSQVIVRDVLVPPWSNVTLLAIVLLTAEALEDLRQNPSRWKGAMHLQGWIKLLLLALLAISLWLVRALCGLFGLLVAVVLFGLLVAGLFAFHNLERLGNLLNQLPLWMLVLLSLAFLLLSLFFLWQVKVLWGLFALLAILFAFYSLPEKGEGKNAHQAGATQT